MKLYQILTKPAVEEKLLNKMSQTEKMAMSPLFLSTLAGPALLWAHVIPVEIAIEIILQVGVTAPPVGSLLVNTLKYVDEALKEKKSRDKT